MEQKLQRVLNAHHLACGAVIAPGGEVVARAGDFDGFGSAGLVSAMLGPRGSAEATYHSVQDPEQIKPVIWGQGNEFAFLDCAGDLVVVVFGRNRGNVSDQYALSQQVGQSIATEFGKQQNPPIAARQCEEGREPLSMRASPQLASVRPGSPVVVNRWAETHAEYAAWLRRFPMLARIGTPGDEPEEIGPSDEPVFRDAPFWSQRTHEAEAIARQHMSDREIDAIIDGVAAVIDEDLRRFDPLVAYYGRFAPNGDPSRIEWEREAAHSVKRDLAWAACERAVGKPGFFSGLLPYYERGRWPVGWDGAYPAGLVRIV
jgi:hypothetical protein